MMTKNKSAISLKYLYLIGLPVLCVLFFAFGKKQQTTILSDKKMVVVIDASHGGDDFGSVVGSVSEKELSLSIARLTREAIKQRGLTVVMTRETDRNLLLADRISASANAKADLFLSIHVATDDDATLHGIDLLISEESSAYKMSLKAGSLLAETLKPHVAVNPIKTSSAYVLKNNPSPAVILELGYLTNEKDRAFIASSANQKIIASQIAAAIAKYATR